MSEQLQIGPSWVCGNNDLPPREDTNAKMMALEGELSDEKARATLAEFLYANPAFMADLVAGVKLFPMQEMLMKGWMLTDYNLCVWSRGGGKSWLVALFCLLWAIFNPGCRIVVISFSFRSSRRILEQCGKFLKDKDAAMLRACFPKDIAKGTDEYSLSCPNGASIICLPLGDGTKIRGVRADLLIVDEFAFLPETIIGEILRPFLAANSKIKEQRELREREDELIASGAMTEEDREIIEDRKKVIFLTSASYHFQHLYHRYCEWIDLLTNPKRADALKASGVSYSVSRIGYEAMPEGLLNMKEIEEARRDLSAQLFDKEYSAKFITDSDAYFRASKMQACSIEDGQSPCLEITGERGGEYILGIDVSLSGSDSSDHFAMCLMKLISRPTDGKRMGMVVHNYAVAGGNMKDHILYLFFLWKHFNIVMIGVDATQGDEVEFINSCNQSKLFKDSGVELLPIEAEFKRENFGEIPAQIRRNYNKTAGRIVQKQPFSSAFQKAANEYLQASFDHKGMIFAAKIAANSGMASKYCNVDLSMLNGHEELGDMTPSQFIDNQDFLLDLTRAECAMIQVRQTALGTQNWDLAQSVRRTTGNLRVRKDSYSALLLCNWCVKMYVSAMEMNIESGPSEFPYMAF